jgi:photosystem II stability/assembly factor-like uncharacterized protein
LKNNIFILNNTMHILLKRKNIILYVGGLFFLIINPANAQYYSLNNTHHCTSVTIFEGNEVENTVPISGFGHLSNYAGGIEKNRAVNDIDGFNWILKFTVPGKVFKDVSFANTQIGYIVTELGAVYKTTDGGDNWVQKMNIGFPYYWYGVYALTSDTVIISGFNNQGDIHTGVARWSFDGGNTWTNDIILGIPAGVGWCSRVHFFDQNRGIISAEFSGAIHYTTTGGKDSASWNYVQVNSDLGWFAGNIDAQPNGNVYTTGIHFAHSSDFGITWTSGPPADNVFDGGVDFLDDNELKGWTGGGQISSPVSGWVHRTTDGAQTWSTRLYTFPYPVRAVKFLNDSVGLAVGGNVYSEAGFIYSTSNSGTNWNLDINTAAEMFSLDMKRVSPDSIDIWCVGSTGSSTGFTGKLYKARISNPVGIISNAREVPEYFRLYQNYPNPFNPSTKIKFDIPAVSFSRTSTVKLTVFDILGREVSVLVNRQMKPGSYEILWEASGLPSGIYFYKLTANGGPAEFSNTRKLILLK